MKWFLGQLSQVSAWTGLIVILCALFTPRWFIILVGALMLLSHDDKLKRWVNENAPGITNWIKEFTEGL